MSDKTLFERVTEAPRRADPLNPSPALLAKLGSVAVHVEEYLSPHGHHFDGDSIDALLSDEEVSGWLTDMRELGLIPEKRNG